MEPWRRVLFVVCGVFLMIPLGPSKAVDILFAIVGAVFILTGFVGGH